MSVDQALRKVLDGSQCRFERTSNGAIVIRAETPPARRETAARAAAPRTEVGPPPASPARPEPPVEAVVSEIVVTAGRRAELPGRAPASITALSGAALAARGHNDTEDLSLDVAGMTVTNLGPGRDKILLRGLSDGVFTGQTQTTVGVYLDDTPITYNAPNPDLRLVDVDRVEVMRGPQGTLYGIGSVGGIVRIVTNKPNLDSYAADAEVSLSKTQHGGGNGDAEVTVNLPLVEGRLAVRGAGYVERRSGYIDDVNLGLKNVNDVARDGYRLSAKAVLNQVWSASIGQVHQSIKTDDTQYEEVGFGALRRGNSVREPHDNAFDETFANLDGDFGWGRLTASSSRLVHHLDDQYDASPLFGRLSGSAAYDENRRIEILVNQLTLASRGAGRFHRLVGRLRFRTATTLSTRRCAGHATGKRRLLYRDPLQPDRRIRRVRRERYQPDPPPDRHCRRPLVPFQTEGRLTGQSGPWRPRFRWNGRLFGVLAKGDPALPVVRPYPALRPGQRRLPGGRFQHLRPDRPGLRPHFQQPGPTL